MGSVKALALSAALLLGLNGCVADPQVPPTPEQLARHRPLPPGPDSAARWLADAPSADAAGEARAGKREGYWHYDGVRYRWMAYEVEHETPSFSRR